MFENNQLTMPLAYILVLVMCMVSLVLLSAVRWLARDLCGKPKLGFHALFGFMLAMDLVWSLAEYTGHQTKFLTFAANAVWYVSFVWICYRWYEDCLQNLNALVMNRWVPRPVRLLPVFAIWLMIGASWWTGQLVGVSEAGCYCRGPYLWVVYAVAFLYLVATIPVCVSSLRRSQSRVTRGAAVSCLMATGMLMLSAYLQYTTGFAFIFIGVIIILAIIDFGAQHMAMEMEAEERDRVLAAEQARSLFFSSVSHDIRTPLNAIVGFAELLEKGVDDPAVREHYIATIRASGKVLARLVNDILDLSKLESGKLEIIAEPTDVPALAREVFEAFGSVQTRKSVRMETDIAAMPLVSVDPQRVRQLLYNLLSNACKYTDRGSVLLRTTWRDGTLTLTVADTGRGISPEDIERILQPFVQVVDRNNRNGTGLGLSICQRLAQLMGGELKIESKLGKGSTFSIVIPNVKTVDRMSVPMPEAERLADTKVRRVMVVDDSSVNRLLLKAMLTRCGVEEVVVAEDGRKALALLRDDPAVDMVLTDLWMPEMDGEGLVSAIRETLGRVRLPVYLVTADVEAVRQHREKGFTGILLKPITQDGVRALVTAIVG